MTLPLAGFQEYAQHISQQYSFHNYEATMGRGRRDGVLLALGGCGERFLFYPTESTRPCFIATVKAAEGAAFIHLMIDKFVGVFEGQGVKNTQYQQYVVRAFLFLVC